MTYVLAQMASYRTVCIHYDTGLAHFNAVKSMFVVCGNHLVEMKAKKEDTASKHNYKSIVYGSA